MQYISQSGRVSVVIPLYNHSSFIAQALESVVAQGEIIREVIVINDGSTDNSLAIAREFSSRHPMVNVVNQINSGAATTINRGIQIATSEYIAILNSDDYWMPKRLTKLIRALDMDASLDLVASDIMFVDGNGVEKKDIWYEAALTNFISSRDLGMSLAEANFLMTTSNYVVRRSALKALGGFAEIRYAHDLDFALRLAVENRRIGFVDEKLLAYRSHANNTIKENQHKVRVDWAMVVAFYLWSLKQKTPEDEARFKKIYAIIEKHELSEAVDKSILYFNRNPSDFLVHNRIIDDISAQSDIFVAV